MRVHQLMSQPARTCLRTTNLAEAVQRMYEGDCGVLPVVDADGRLAGIVTDRDICIALATRHGRAEDTAVKDVMRSNVFAIEAHQDVRDAMRLMAREQVRRLPVLGEDGRVKGVLSLNDLIMGIHAHTRADSEPTVEDLFETLQAICLHPRTVALRPARHPFQSQA